MYKRQPLVDYVSKLGKRVIIIGLGRGYTSVELIRACDEYYNMDEMEGVIKEIYPSSMREE